MESTMKISSSITFPINSTPKLLNITKFCIGLLYPMEATPSPKSAPFSQMALLLMGLSQGQWEMCMDGGRLESLFCYDKPIPEERIEEPVGVSLAEKIVGDNPRCSACQAKCVVLCTTCAGSGLYVDSILESQGIIVKVRCLGCGGTGNVMCSECGGRCHRGPK